MRHKPASDPRKTGPEGPEAESPPNGHNPTPDRMLLDLPQVMRALQMSRSAIYAAVDRGGFPAPIRIGPRSVGWIAAEILAWVNSRPRAGSSRRAGDARR